MIKIVGAGIAGLICAIKLSELGHKALIFDKRSAVGERFHNDFQGIDNWSTKNDFADTLKTIGVDLNKVAYRGTDVTVIGPKQKTYLLNSEQPLFYLVKRGVGKDTLDSYLYEIARQRGVSFAFNSPIRNLNDADIVAIGPDSSQAIGLAAGITFKTNLGNGIWLHADTKYNRSGYNYLIVINQQATLTSCGIRGKFSGKADLETALNFFRNFVGEFEMDDIKSFGGYGANKTIGLSPQKVIIGEAAGFQDHLFGFGMRYAIESALLAADHFGSVSRYNGMVNSRITPRIRKTIFWRKAIYDFAGNPAISALCMATRKNPRTVLRFLYG